MIRLAEYGVKINGSSLGADQGVYESEVATQVGGISVQTTGAALLWGLSTHGLPVTIVPMEPGKCNAEFTRPSNILQFWPRTWMSRFKTGCNTPGMAGMSPREVLFHELVHALRDVSGKWRRQNLVGQIDGFTRNEEFIAVMLSNIFSSELGNPLRVSNTTTVAVAPGAEDPARSEVGRKLIQVVKKDHPEMCRRIAQSRAPYNPIRDL